MLYGPSSPSRRSNTFLEAPASTSFTTSACKETLFADQQPQYAVGEPKAAITHLECLCIGLQSAAACAPVLSTCKKSTDMPQMHAHMYKCYSHGLKYTCEKRHVRSMPSASSIPASAGKSHSSVLAAATAASLLKRSACCIFPLSFLSEICKGTLNGSELL